MAITIQTQIQGQQATDTATYCYLYEPLNIVIKESDATAKKLFIDLVVIETDSNTIVNTLAKYGDFDLSPNKPFTIDLMSLAQQHHDSNLYKYSRIEDLASLSGWHSVVSKYKYIFSVYTDKTTIPVKVRKLPIIGGRNFKDFSPTVQQNTHLTEFQKYNVNVIRRWSDFKSIVVNLADPNLNNAKPSVTVFPSRGAKHPCGGFLIWKSRFGGWCFWGFDIKTERTSHKYSGSLDVGMFESTQQVGGNPFVESNYTGVSSTYSKTFKALSLSSNELKAVSGINSSPAIYQVFEDGRVELMRLVSATAPIDTKSNGGDFTVSLKSISTTYQKTK